MSDSESLPSVDSECDDSEWNYILGSPNIKRNFQEEVEDLSVLASEEADEEDVVIPYADEPLASQQFTEQYNRKRAIEEKLMQKLQQRVDGVDPWKSWLVR